MTSKTDRAGQRVVSATSRRALIGAGLAMLSPLARPALGQSGWRPVRPIRVVVPFPPGGATDMLARLISQKLSDSLGQPLVVENRPGANGVVASQYLLSSPPDGHSLLLATGDTHTVLPLAHKKLPYNAADFVPVSGLASVVFSLVTRPGLPVTDTQSLIALARQARPPLTFASYGYASISHAAGEMFNKATGVEMVHVPYQGAGPAILAITANQVDVMMVPVAVAQPQRANLKMLAVATERRFAMVPEIPTLKEQGYDVVADAWIGLLAAPHTPQAVADAVHAGVAKVMATPEMQETLRTNGFGALGYDPQRFAEFLRSEAARWGEVVRSANITVEG